MTASDGDANGPGNGGLKSRSFVALLVVQGLGALNDNVFRWFCVQLGTKTVLGDNTVPLGLACFTVPYLLLASYAAFAGDRFSKRQTIVTCKVAEILIMSLAIGAMALLGVSVTLGLSLVFVSVFLMGSQSAMFGPAKFGAIPELVPSEKISEANGLMQMITTGASALGMFIGFALSDVANLDPAAPTLSALIWPAGFLVSVAILGTFASLYIKPLTPADPTRPLPNPVTETASNLSLLYRNRPLFRAALGEAFFWFLAALATSAITLLGPRVLGLSETNTGLLAVALVLGVGAGSVLAGRLSGGKVELGLVPLGAIVIAAAAIGLYLVTGDVDPTDLKTQVAAIWPAAFFLVLLGLGSGFFIVPLVAFIQDRSERRTRGTIIAAANFVTFSLTLASAGVFWLLTDPGMLNWSPPTVFLAAGLATIPIVIYVVWLLPQATARFFLWMLSKLFYRVSVHGRKNIPDQGGALLVANHVSYLDAFLLMISSSRPIRFLAYTDYVTGFGIGMVTRMMGVIPIRSSGGPKEIIRSLRAAKEAVQAGELVCIFPEGELTQDGELQEFQRGMIRILDGVDAPLVPVYLDQLWGSIFSFEGGRYFWKWPHKLPYPVSILFGAPQACPDTAEEVREIVRQLGEEAAGLRDGSEPPEELDEGLAKSLTENPAEEMAVKPGDEEADQSEEAREVQETLETGETREATGDDSGQEPGSADDGHRV